MPYDMQWRTKKNAKGIDCSGAVCELLKVDGINASGTSENIYEKATEKFSGFESFAEIAGDLRHGDLLFEDTGNKTWDKGRKHGIDHVGMVIQGKDGNLMFFQSDSARGVNIMPLSQAIEEFDRKAVRRYVGRYSGVKEPQMSDVVTVPKGTNPNENKVLVKSYLESIGYSPAAVAGIMGNIAVETGSTFDPLLKQKGGNGYGLFQYDFMRKYYEQYLKDNNKQDGIQSQIDYMDDVINGKVNMMSAANRKKLKEALNTLDDPQEIARIFMEIFENPGVPHLDRRTNNAKQIYDEFYSS
jgi:hypothetical protein